MLDLRFQTKAISKIKSKRSKIQCFHFFQGAADRLRSFYISWQLAKESKGKQFCILQEIATIFPKRKISQYDEIGKACNLPNFET